MHLAVDGKNKRKIRGAHGRLQRGRTVQSFPHSRMKIDSSFILVGLVLLCACFSNGLPAAAAAEEAPRRFAFCFW